MTAQKPTFRVMKNGYDRFAVDDAIDRYAAMVDQLQRKVELYQQQLVETTRQLEEIKGKYESLQAMDASRKEAAENIARLSLREANQIIATAQKNADEIIRTAISTSRLILMDLSKLYSQAGEVKTEMKGELTDLIKALDSFRIPEMPDLKWLEEAETKLR
ncbi:MAG: DivIVA domain-containing protein [Bulleidia sp.]|nr:DivIVA domain-containing protein [Erysipelotrichaceae bacterium]MDD6663279.1 DivIVA domain-containing protein [Bulleidia sp.]MDY4809300.1 DivIVA domain-containing protein [Bulleidia sp.]